MTEAKYTPKFLSRFWSKVDKNGPIPVRSPELGPCWIWIAGTFRHGYGKITVNHKSLKAHRLSYEIANGPFSQELCVLHTCDNPGCVNPRHLFLGTLGDNNRDRAHKGRGGTAHGEQHANSKLTDEQAEEIRRLYATGEWYQQQLAKVFNVSQTLISLIVLRKQRR